MELLVQLASSITQDCRTTVHKFNKGSRAAVALVTSVRSNLAEDETENARKLSMLMRDIIAESDPHELAATLYTLTIMAANPMDGEQLEKFALEVSTSTED
jgi:hypothetical protein